MKSAALVLKHKPGSFQTATIPVPSVLTQMIFKNDFVSFESSIKESFANQIQFL